MAPRRPIRDADRRAELSDGETSMTAATPAALKSVTLEKKHRPNAILIEDKVLGSPLISQLKSAGIAARTFFSFRRCRAGTFERITPVSFDLLERAH